MTKIIVDEELSPAARAARLAQTAREGSAALIREGRATAKFRRFVDGVEGAPETAVRPDGVIVYEFSYMAEIIVFALAFLRARSPVGPGTNKSKAHPRAFRDCFMVAVDGRPIPAAAFKPESVPLDAECIIYNTQPYSRKIDVQLVGGQALRFSVPPGLFNDAMRAVRRQFGNVATAARVYSVNHPNQYVLRRGKKAGGKVHSPALILTPLD